MLEKVSRSKRFGSHAGRQEVNGCHTSGESDKSIPYTRKEAQDQLWNLGQMLPEVQNRSISGLMSSKRIVSVYSFNLTNHHNLEKIPEV